jgi:hypothetical protein
MTDGDREFIDAMTLKIDAPQPRASAASWRANARGLLRIVERLQAQVLALRVGRYDLAEEAWGDAQGMFAPDTSAEFRLSMLAQELRADGVGPEIDARAELEAKVEQQQAEITALRGANVMLVKAFNGDRSSTVEKP